MIKTARAIAALDGRQKATQDDLKRAAMYVLPHRMHKNPMDSGAMNPERMDQILKKGKTTDREAEAPSGGD